MSMNTPIGNITQITPIKDFKELDEMQNEQYLLGIDNNAVGNGSKISLENLINSSISTDSDNLITKGTDDKLLVNTPIEIGDLSNLTTTNKSTLVAAINEVDSDITTETTTRANADNNLQSQIDAITAASDVTDIVGTYAELQAYDTTGLPDNSIIKVLQDESRQDETTYYRWVITGGVGAWVLIGEEGPYYTKSQSDSKFATQTTVGNLSNLATSDKSSVVNAINELSNVLDPTQTADYIKNSKAIYSGEISENALILPQIKEMFHSTFDRSKFTVVGSPNITDDGIASGFSGSNYLTKTLSQSLTLDKVDVWGSFVSSSATSGHEIILAIATDSQLVNTVLQVALNRSTGQIQIGCHNDTTWSGHNSSTNTISALTKYYYHAYYKDGYIKLDLSIDGTTYTNVINDVITVSSSFTSNKIYIGSITQATNYFKGSIDLSQFSITVDGVEIFSGNKTGIDTIKPDDYTVVGSPVISADGIITNWSNVNTIKYLNAVNLGNSTNYEIHTRILTPLGVFDKDETNTLSEFITISNSGNTNWSLNIYTQNHNNVSVNGAGISYAGIGNINTSIAFLDFVIKNDGTNFTVTAYKPDGTIFETSRTSPTAGNNLPLETVTVTTNNSNYFSTATPVYQIDMNYTKIYVNGNLVYQPCLKLPYTWSKTGSKIVDSIYRDRVNDMAEQFGYANYYTLQDESKGNYQVVGSPTISSDFVASGFSGGNYLSIPTGVNVTDTNFEIDIPFVKTANNTVITSTTVSNSGNQSFALIHANNKLLLFLGGGSSWNIAGEVAGITNCQNNVQYIAKLIRTSTQYIVKLLNVETGVETTEITIDSTTNLGDISTLFLGVPSYWSSIAYNITYDLKQFKIYVDNKLAYQAITDPNFTLPQGELYGMIQRNAIPDYSTGVSKVFGQTYTAESDGYVYIYVFSTGDSGITINGVELILQSGNGGEPAVTGASGFIPVGKGDVYTPYLSGGAFNSICTFFPVRF